jgi:predicted ATP-dependent protease
VVSQIKSLEVDKFRKWEKDTAKLAALPLNGRQIKNVVKMAGMLADENAGELKPEHFDTALEFGKWSVSGNGSDRKHDVSLH